MNLRVLALLAAVVLFLLAGLDAIGAITGMNVIGLDSFGAMALALSFLVP